MHLRTQVAGGGRVKFHIFDFETNRFVEVTKSYETGFDRCIELYLRSGKKRSFYVGAVSA